MGPGAVGRQSNGRTSRRIDGWTGGRTQRRADRRADRWTDPRTDVQLHTHNTGSGAYFHARVQRAGGPLACEAAGLEPAQRVGSASERGV